MSARLRTFLDNPLSGLAPWIVVAVMSGIVPFEAAVLLSFATAGAILAASLLTGGAPKALEFSDTAYFLLLAIVGLVASEDVREWLRVWADELSSIALVLIAVGSIAVRRPFTLPYARERVPPEMWTTPRFIRTNHVVSAAWAGGVPRGGDRRPLRGRRARGLGQSLDRLDHPDRGDALRGAVHGLVPARDEGPRLALRSAGFPSDGAA
jgi:hypothetical protein